MSSRRGLMLVLSSPSGTGKTTLSRKLVAEDKDLSLSISCTTRQPREGEKDGEHYHFMTRDEFRHARAQAGFLEWAEVHDNFYGSPKEPIMKALENGRDIIFDIDWQGAQQLEINAPKDVVSVFILPPSMKELRRRLTDRATDSIEIVKKRMNNAYGEIARAETYDYVLVNDDFDKTYEKLKAILRGERLSRYRQPWLHGFIQGLLSEDT